MLVLCLSQCIRFQAMFAGGEANVAVSVANYGLRSRYVTALPSNPLGDAAIRALRAMDVETEQVIRRPGRVGVYFLEAGAAQRASTVVYDRDGAAIQPLGAGLHAVLAALSAAA